MNKRKNLIKSYDYKKFEKRPASITYSNLTFKTENFLNRDLSWLSFNERVLVEAQNKSNPLLERIRFLDIFRSNNDEFFMKRVNFHILSSAARNKVNFDGISKLELHSAVIETAVNQNIALKKTFLDIKEELEKNSIKLCDWSDINSLEKKNLYRYFRKNIFPILTPLAVDSGHPFPFLSNLSKSIGLILKKPGQDERFFARVKVPNQVNQWVQLPKTKKHEYRFINIEHLIKENISDLFTGMEIEASSLFRVTRFAALEDDEDEPEDKMEWVEEELRERKFAPVIRLEFEEKVDDWIKEFLSEELDVKEDCIFYFHSPAQYQDFSEIYNLPLSKLKFKKFNQSIPKELIHNDKNIFQAIKRKDILVHFPYQSFTHTVEELVKQASSDPKVKAIKIILYRTDTHGKLINYLIQAAENKKQVVCIIELKARFDEERNIKWAQKLEETGVHVSYGLIDKKTHAKMIAIVREDQDALRTYTYIGTGNFNSQTSKFYTDMGLFSAKQKIGLEVLEVFNYLTGRSIHKKYSDLLVAPFNMFSSFKKMILDQGRLAQKGHSVQIIAKMNQLEDSGIITSLYKASQQGVKIKLYVRGFCCLRPGIKGLSENIEVISFVGRLLEHSRIFYFSTPDKDPLQGDFYIGSADWMSRNLHDRVEVIAPIKTKEIKKRIWTYLTLLNKDTRNAWYLQGNGDYIKEASAQEEFNSQEFIIKGS